MDAMKVAAQMQETRQSNMATMGVDVLKHLSNKSHEEQLRAMQERIQTRQQQARAPKKGE